MLLFWEKKATKGALKMAHAICQPNLPGKLGVVNVMLKNSFDFKDSKIHPQAVENLKRYMNRKNAKTK
jgi:hypothetical protein